MARSVSSSGPGSAAGFVTGAHTAPGTVMSPRAKPHPPSPLAGSCQQQHQQQQQQQQQLLAAAAAEGASSVRWPVVRAGSAGADGLEAGGWSRAGSKELCGSDSKAAAADVHIMLPLPPAPPPPSAHSLPRNGSSSTVNATGGGAVSRGNSQQRYSCTSAVSGGDGGGGAAALQLHDSAGHCLSGLSSAPGAAAGGVGAGDGNAASSLPLLRGKRVLLLEPCAMVRQVLMLALRSWGCRVAAAGSEREAVARLVAAGTLKEHLVPPLPAAEPPPPPRAGMTLTKTAQNALDGGLYDEPGPYDGESVDVRQGLGQGNVAGVGSAWQVCASEGVGVAVRVPVILF